MTQRTVLWPYPVGPRVAAPHTRAAGITALKWAEKTSRAVQRQICMPSRRHQASSSSTWSPQGEGAFAALDYAVSYPNTLLTLVLACSTLNIQEKDIQARVNGITAPRSASLPAYFYELGPTYRAADPQGTQRWRSLERTSQLAGNVVQGGHQSNRVGDPASDAGAHVAARRRCRPDCAASHHGDGRASHPQQPSCHD
jgi:hypothetical protein